MIQIITITGKALDIAPNQEVSFTIENAFFSTDHIDTPWSTDFELRITANNCAIFMYVPAMLLPPRKTTVQATCLIDGMPVMQGIIEVLSYSNSSIKVSFTGRDIANQLTGYLNELPLEEWNFGKMNDLTEFREFIHNAVQGKFAAFEAPLLLRSDQLDYSQDANHIITGPNSDRETSAEKMAIIREYWNGRYANFINYIQKYTAANKTNLWERTGVPYIIPVVRLSYLLSLITNLKISSDQYLNYLSKIGILAPNKKNAMVSDIYHGGLDEDENGDYILSLAAGLPKIKVATVLKEVVNIIAATVYLENGAISIRPNSDIINDPGYIDWTDKIAEDFSCDIEEGCAYIYGYQDTENSTAIDQNEVQNVDSYYDIYKLWNDGAFDKTKNYVFKIKTTGDIYSVFFEGTINGHPEFSLLKRGGDKEATAPASDDEDELTTYNAQTNAKLVKCIPATMFFSDYFLWYGVFMAAVVDIPKIGSDPTENITIGILQDRQMVDKGVTLARNDAMPELLITENPITTPLTLSKEDPLYLNYHKPYKDFLAKSKSAHTLELDITARDIADLKIWKKRLLYNQLFFIKSIVITTNTSTDYFHAEGIFVRV